VTDDYYEDRALADITAKGLIPGALVGELPDPTATASSNVPAASAPGQTSSGGTQGIYRAGGPTTLFGGSGWGPFSDGPHSAVRKSMLSREGLTEENWMWETARRVTEMNEGWAKMRKEARIACGGILEGNSNSGKGKAKEEMNGAMDVDGQGGTGRKRKADDSNLPLGVYEPHTGVVHCAYTFRSSSWCWFIYPILLNRSCRHSAYSVSLGTSVSSTRSRRYQGRERGMGIGLGGYLSRAPRPNGS
jgi:chromatin structure-remodeling complex protein RSC7